MTQKREKIHCIKKMKEIMFNYYVEAKEAHKHGKKVAWITSGGPVEPLLAMDIIPVYPENHAAMVGATKMGGEMCTQAEEMGYSRDICSYARTDLACAVTNGGPIGGLPRPDMLVCCNNICGTVLKWYECQARLFNVPLFIFDTPICHTDFSPEIKDYVQAQVNEYLSFLEEHTGQSMDQDRLKEVGRCSVQTQRLWQEILRTTTHRPAPMSAFDAFFHLALIVTLRGTEICREYYQELLLELQARIQQGICAVPGEKYRLMWDNLPIWYKTRWLSKKLATYQACLVADTYTSAWCSSLRYIDEDDFPGSMAAGYTRIYLNLGLDLMAREILEMIDTYQADGLIMHSNRSCKPYSFGQYDLQQIIQGETGIPVLILEADMVDERNFSESQAATRIEAFMEMVMDKKTR